MNREEFFSKYHRTIEEILGYLKFEFAGSGYHSDDFEEFRSLVNMKMSAVNFEKFSSVGNKEGYVYRTIHNAKIDFMKKKKKEREKIESREDYGDFAMSGYNQANTLNFADPIALEAFRAVANM